ncbi:hypothetical protein BDZ91DRAFT_499436 [Kalaharituber pfeilii]|nr:hypothetical protein BDZ91DRAFT_499436 [Kalaharituber pfeilii]
MGSVRRLGTGPATGVLGVPEYIITTGCWKAADISACFGSFFFYSFSKKQEKVTELYTFSFWSNGRWEHFINIIFPTFLILFFLFSSHQISLLFSRFVLVFFFYMPTLISYLSTPYQCFILGIFVCLLLCFSS